MDVTCERCQAEYDFDESLLGGKGTTVKCAECQHVFRVEPPAEDARGKLQVRFKATGKIASLSSLRELQRQIHDGRITGDDELGRDGFPWRRLGDVPELRNFFTQRSSGTLRPGAASTAAGPGNTSAPVAPAAPPGAAEPGRESRPHNEKSDTMRGPGPDKEQREALGEGVLNPSVPRAPALPQLAVAPTSAPPPGPPAAPGAASIHPPAGKPAAPPSPPQAAAKPRSVPAPPAPSSALASAGAQSAWGEAASQSGAGLYLADDDEITLPRSGGSRLGLWVVLAVLVAGVGWVGITVLGTRRAEDAAESEQIAAAPAGTQAAVSNPSPTTAAEAGDAGPQPSPAVAPEAPVAAKPSQAASPPRSAARPSAGSGKGSAGERADRPRRRGLARDYGGLVEQGDTRLERGDTDGAMEAYRAALEQRGTGSEANTGMGYAMLDRGMARQAVSYFQRAARNGYAEASLGLGDAYRKQGQPGEAMKAYQRYLERLPSGSRAHYARAQIDRLEAAAARPAPPPPSGQPAPSRPTPPSGAAAPDVAAPQAPAPTPPQPPSAPPPAAPSTPAPAPPTAPVVPSPDAPQVLP